MAKKVMLGGERLGAGGKRQVEQRSYERSTHDLSHVVKTTQSIGTVVPVLTMVALPGDSIDIDMNVLLKTNPTTGPLFSSYKVQIDVFKTPVGLYNANMYMNMVKQGLKMSNVKLPLFKLRGVVPDRTKPMDNQHTHSSSIFARLGVRGIGYGKSAVGELTRDFNAVPWLIYWDCIKNYYANKQEGIGYVIHNTMKEVEMVPTDAQVEGGTGQAVTITEVYTENVDISVNENATISFNIDVIGTWNEWDVDRLVINYKGKRNAHIGGYDTWSVKATELWSTWTWDETEGKLRGSGWQGGTGIVQWNSFIFDGSNQGQNGSPRLVPYELDNIDRQRIEILKKVGSTDPLYVGVEEPYSYALEGDRKDGFSATSNQEGLAVKTYQADQFNNWVATEYLDGANGINEISAITVQDGKIYIDDINMQNKVYNMLMNIAVSGGTINDWQEANWNVTRKSGVINPMYIGGLSKEMVFEEVVSNASTNEQPLGTLAGRGRLTDKHKGGRVNVRVDEISYITAYISITPRIGYSQGNEWDSNLKTMDDFHKPALDQIAFQDLITDKMAWWDTYKDEDNDELTFRSAGKIPAWTDYMTNQDKISGNFADMTQQGWMVNNRNYEPNITNTGMYIKDLTTYIDPVKHNFPFADARLDAQNIWTQVAFDITARRLMSAKIMPKAV